MMRPFGILALYVVAGTIFTIVGYRLILNGPLADAVAEKSVDGLVIFLSIVMNIALVFAAAGVASVMLEQSRASFLLILLASAAITGVVGAGMMFWFSGLSIAFPVTMGVGGALCALLANVLGLLRGNT
jgi:hypothetical protein